MSNAHVCDECKTVAPLQEAIRWWQVESIEDVLYYGEKSEYHFCSWQCMADYARRMPGVVAGHIAEENR